MCFQISKYKKCIKFCSFYCSLQIPVYLSKQLSDHLYIYQYPLRQSNLKYDTAVIKSCAIKPQHKEVKLEMGLNVNSMNFDMNKAEEIAINTDGSAGFNREKDEEAIFENEIMDKQSFISTKAVEDCSKYAVGIVHGNEIHITPLKGKIFHYFLVQILKLILKHRDE